MYYVYTMTDKSSLDLISYVSGSDDDDDEEFNFGIPYPSKRSSPELEQAPILQQVVVVGRRNVNQDAHKDAQDNEYESYEII